MNLPCLAALLTGASRPTSVQDEDGWTALHFAATKGHVELVELLLRSRADHAIKVRSILGDHPCPVLRPLDSQ